MGEIIRLTIGNRQREMAIIEYRGQRVVTLKEIDELHQRPEHTASRNFSANRIRFVEGVDFFKLTFAEASCTNFVELVNPNGLTLITESGYLMLAKSLTDDLAWEVQRELVNGYFRGRQPVASNIGDLLSNPDVLVELVTRYRDENKARLTAEAKVAELEPKAAFHDQVADTVNCIAVAKFAKLMGTGEKRMFAWLRSQGLLMTGNVPYQRYIDEGYFKVREGTYPHPGDEQQERCSYVQTTITGKGQTYLQKRWAKDGNAVQLWLVEGFVPS